MLKILFSPSEGKNSGGNETKKDLLGALGARDEILNQYNDIILRADEQEIKDLFGIKKFEDFSLTCKIFSTHLLCVQ